jgi:hypothetical protein
MPNRAEGHHTDDDHFVPDHMPGKDNRLQGTAPRAETIRYAHSDMYLRVTRFPIAPRLSNSFSRMFTGSGLGKVETHLTRYPYRSWLDAAAVPIAVQQQLLRCTVLCPTMNVYGDIATDEMSVASAKVANLKINGKLNDRYGALGYQKWRKRMGVEPIGDRIACRPPVLKTGTITGPHALPCKQELATDLHGFSRIRTSATSRITSREKDPC